jgi:hypothetical protein
LKELIKNNEFNNFIEICEMSESEVSGRVKITMTALEIHQNNSQYNKNGITWIEEYVKNNLQSIIGCPYTVCWLDEENQIPSDHGMMSFNSDGEVEFEGVTVGSIQEAYIEDRLINGETKRVLTTVGYIYKQRYPRFVEFLKKEIKNNKIYGSIEINGKSNNKNIIYLDGDTNPDGTKKNGRVPVEFDFTGLSVLYLVDPADDNSQILELNSKLDLDTKKLEEKEVKREGMKLVKNGQTIEINNLDSYSLQTMLEKAFRIAIGDVFDCEDHRYYIEYLYPLNSQFIIRKWKRHSEKSNYYMSSYQVNEDNRITLGDIYEVEQTWSPINNEKPIEMNQNQEANQVNPQDMEKMQKDYEAMKMNYENMSKDYETMKMNYENMSKDKETMSKHMEENSAKMTEVNEALVNANKAMEEMNAKMEQMTSELNACKEELNTYKTENQALKLEKMKMETNTYFENEIKKNNFAEAELNSLTEYVSNGDLEGLKKAEIELCAKKFKEMALAKDTDGEDFEVNSTGFFVTTKEVKPADLSNDFDITQ